MFGGYLLCVVLELETAYSMDVRNKVDTCDLIGKQQRNSAAYSVCNRLVIESIVRFLSRTSRLTKVV